MRNRSTRSWLVLAAVASLALVGLPPAQGALSLDPSLGGAGAGGSRLAETLCGTLSVIRLPDGKFFCTHGPDPVPDGIDFRLPQPLVDEGSGDQRSARGLILPDPPGGPPSGAAAATPGIACYGDGMSGNRVLAMYGFTSDRPDRYAQVLPSIRQWAAEVDAVFRASAAETGGERRIRFVTDANCDLVVQRVQLSPTGDDTFGNTVSELARQGYNRPDRKYLLWLDSTVLCGIAGYYLDDRPGQDNFNNGNPNSSGLVARTDSGCWGLASRGQAVEAHELMHSLGAVLPSAPNATAAGHCTDGADRMCYADGSTLALRLVCGAHREAIFDCNNDDYFHTAPRPGSYLALRWNTARSSFLSSGASNPTIDIGDVAVREGNSDTTPAAFRVSLSAAAPNQSVSVRFATADITARAGEDYVATNGILTFAAGETTKTITVAVRGDVLPELDETFAVVLSNPVNAVIGRGQGIGTIIDDDPKGQGYWLVAADGGMFSYADARFFGSTGNIRLNQPVVGMAASPTGRGYWLVATDGGIFAFGDARFFGSTGNIRLNQPIVGMASTPTGSGYWFVARDGGVFAFGDARFFGSGSRQAVVGMAPTPTGGGYWLAGQDGAVSAYGDAPFLGEATRPNQPIVGIAASPTGRGYWLVARDGGIFAFGDARFFGSTGNIRLNQPIVGMASSPSGGGYWLVATDGGIFAFGDAGFWGSTGDISLNQPIVGIGTTPGR